VLCQAQFAEKPQPETKRDSKTRWLVCECGIVIRCGWFTGREVRSIIGEKSHQSTRFFNGATGFEVEAEKDTVRLNTSFDAGLVGSVEGLGVER
jgi:hypothetical protein